VLSLQRFLHGIVIHPLAAQFVAKDSPQKELIKKTESAIFTVNLKSIAANRKDWLLSLNVTSIYQAALEKHIFYFFFFPELALISPSF